MTVPCADRYAQTRNARRRICRSRLAAVPLCLSMLAGPAAAQVPPLDKPRVPAGVDPGGVTVAVIGSGIDYTSAEIAARLARDGEGELIGWDFVEGDRRPFEKCGARAQSAGHCNETPLVFLASPRVRVIPLRVTIQKPQSLVEAVRFATRAGARIILVALPSPVPERFIDEAAAWHTAPLFIATASPDPRKPPVRLAAGANSIVINAAVDSPETAAATTAGIVGTAVACAARGNAGATALRDCALSAAPQKK